MRRTLIALLFALLLSVPAASAGWLGRDPVVVTVPAPRVGDQSRLEYAWESADEGGVERDNFTLVLAIEAQAQTVDRFGVGRETYVVRTEMSNATGLFWAERCHSLVGGVQAVKHERLYGVFSSSFHASSRSFTGVGPVGLQSRSSESEGRLVESYEGGLCMGNEFLGGQTFREKQRVTFRDLFVIEGFDDAGLDVASEPARKDSFHGRPALTFTWSLADLYASELESGDRVTGTVALTLADGLPGIARFGFDGRFESADGTETGRGTSELVGHVTGKGPALHPYRGERLPERNEDARFEPFRRLSIPEEGLGLEYSFAQALADARASPRVGVDDWLEAHEEAYVSYARFSVDEDSNPVEGPKRSLHWLVSLTDPASATQYTFTASRSASALTQPAGILPPAASALTATVVDLGEQEAMEAVQTLPERVAGGQTMAHLAVAHGIRRDAVHHVQYHVGEGWEDRPLVSMRVSDVADVSDSPRVEGRLVAMDSLAGGVTGVYLVTRKTETRSLIDPFPAEGDLRRSDQQVSALALLGGPAVGSGLAAGGAAATSLALLVLLAKFVFVPFFTRLRRAKVLDNPVRARIYEHVRANAGTHLGEVVDLAGIGSGATRHHLKHLVAHGFVVELREGGYLRFYATGEVPPDVARREAVLRAGSHRAVYDLYAERPDLSLREAAARLGLSAPAVHRAKRKLEKAGLLPSPGEIRPPVRA